MFDIHFTNSTEIIVHTDVLDEIAQKICAGEMGDKGMELSVLLCESNEMQEFNRLYRGQDKATDILSFVHNEGSGFAIPGYQNTLLCDIIIDIIQVDKQKGSNSFDQELLKVFIHGMLHLVGFDHIKKAEKEEMETKEDYYYRSMRGEDHSGRQ